MPANDGDNASDRDDPPHVRQKVNFLQTHVLPRRILGHSASFTDLARKLEITREVFRDQITRRVLPSDTQAKLASKLSFRLDWPEWADGTATAFESRYLKENRVTERPKASVRLVKAPLKPPHRSKAKGLAAVELFPTQVGRGSAEIGFEISCGKAYFFGIPVSIRVGEVAFDCGGGQLDPETRQGRRDPYRVGDVQLQWNGGDSFNPAWRVESDGPTIGNVDIPPDFGRIIGLSAGSTVTITFGVWRPDIEEDSVAETSPSSLPFDGISIAGLESGSDPSHMSITKRRILMRLAGDALDALEQRSGFIVLARHEVTFIAHEEDE